MTAEKDKLSRDLPTRWKEAAYFRLREPEMTIFMTSLVPS